MVSLKEVIRKYRKRAEESIQIAEWLEELREYKKDRHRKLKHTYNAGYGRAINDFIEKLGKGEVYDGFGNPINIHDIEESLKENNSR